MWVFVATMGVLLGPKLLASSPLLVHPASAARFGGASGLFGGRADRNSARRPHRARRHADPIGSGRLHPVRTRRRLAPPAARGRALPCAKSPAATGRTPSPGWSSASHRRWYRSALLWMTPVVLGLGLAIPLAAWTAQREPGAALARVGLLSRRRSGARRRSCPATPHCCRIAPSDPDPVRQLLADPGLLAAHRAMLAPPRRKGDPHDADLLLARAKLEEADEIDDALRALTRQSWRRSRRRGLPPAPAGASPRAADESASGMTGGGQAGSDLSHNIVTDVLYSAN